MNPKRCGHLDGKQVVEASVAPPAHQRRRGGAPRPQLLDHRAHRRAGDALARRGDRRADRDYVDVGADAIFPEALLDLASSKTFARPSTCRCSPTRPSSARASVDGEH